MDESLLRSYYRYAHRFCLCTRIDCYELFYHHDHVSTVRENERWYQCVFDASLVEHSRCLNFPAMKINFINMKYDLVGYYEMSWSSVLQTCPLAKKTLLSLLKEMEFPENYAKNKNFISKGSRFLVFGNKKLIFLKSNVSIRHEIKNCFRKL